MSVRKINIHIDPFDTSSIEDAIRQIDTYEKELKEKMDKAVQETAQESVNLYNSKVASIWGNDDLNQTASETGAVLEKLDDAKYSVVAEGKALFLEFGTGINNADNQTARADLRNSPKVVPHGEYGHKFGRNPNGWVYQPVSGEYRHTKGFNAQAPLYETKKETKDILTKKMGGMFK